jgi:hypothetical protein
MLLAILLICILCFQEFDAFGTPQVSFRMILEGKFLKSFEGWGFLHVAILKFLLRFKFSRKFSRLKFGCKFTKQLFKLIWHTEICLEIFTDKIFSTNFTA